MFIIPFVSAYYPANTHHTIHPLAIHSVSSRYFHTTSGHTRFLFTQKTRVTVSATVGTHIPSPNDWCIVFIRKHVFVTGQDLIIASTQQYGSGVFTLTGDTICDEHDTIEICMTVPHTHTYNPASLENTELGIHPQVSILCSKIEHGETYIVEQ